MGCISRLHMAILYLTLFFGAFLCMTLTMSSPISVYDEGGILTGAMRVGEGELPHRDFYTAYGPAQYYVVALLFKIFGPSALIERLWDSCVKAAVATLSFAAVRQHCESAAAYTTYGASLIWLAMIGSVGYPLFPAILFSLAGILLLLSHFGSGSRPVQVVASGGCIGLTALFRYDVGGLVCIVLLAFLILTALGRRENTWRALADGSLMFAIGVGLVVGPAAMFYLSQGGPISAFVDNVFVYSTYYVWTRGLPFPSLGQISTDPSLLAIYVPLAVMTVAAIAAWQKRTAPIAGVIAGVTGVCAAFYLKGWVRVSALHMAGAYIFALVLLPIVWGNMPKSVMARLMIIACYFLIAFPTIFALKALVDESGRNETFLSGFLSIAHGTQSLCGAPTYLSRVSCFEVDSNWSESIKFIGDNLPQGDRLFVGLTRHDKVFVSDDLIYFATGRMPVTKWHHYNPGLQTRADIQTEIAAELERSVPRLIVLESTWDAVVEPNGSAVSSGVTILDDYISRNYVTVRKFGTISLLARREARIDK
jgi:hypothetical protein